MERVRLLAYDSACSRNGTLTNEFLSPKQTVIGMPAMNPPGIYLRQREYFTTDQAVGSNNLNTMFPGQNPELGISGPSGLAHQVWNDIWEGGANVDVHVDLRKLTCAGSIL